MLLLEYVILDEDDGTTERLIALSGTASVTEEISLSDLSSSCKHTFFIMLKTAASKCFKWQA